MKVLISVGPIPATLDSVKFITNKFKGGLALKTAEKLKELGNDVFIIAWENTNLNTKIPIIKIKDVMDYYHKILNFEADAYILAGAVANLMPLNPYPKKFPSHLYKVGDVFNIEFTIAPRVIDKIKEAYPNKTLIGYKLFDGSDEELISSAEKTLKDSKANIVFANNPLWAKEKKIALTQDGAVFTVSFDEHIQLIDKLIKEQFYSTTIVNKNPTFTPNEQIELDYLIDYYPRYHKKEQVFGSFAFKLQNGFVTTTRGKKENDKGIAYVLKVDHKEKKVYSNKKATLNAPLLDSIFIKNPNLKYIVHGHENLEESKHPQYEFPGTVGDNIYATMIEPNKKIYMKNHGYIIGFETFEQLLNFLKEN